MQRIAAFIVRFHGQIFAFFMALAVVCSFMAVQVGINADMTKYLPASMQMKQGTDIMNEEFGEGTPVELMVRGPQSTQEREDFASALQEFSHIDSVSYEAGSARFNNGDYALYRITVADGPYSDAVDKACNEARGACEVRGYECWIDTECLNNAANNLEVVLVIGVILAMIILFILAASWLEPLFLLFTILVAVLINFGTNLPLGEVSDVTASCGAILQMVLSMDYLIMLLNRYRKEHAPGVDPRVALENALVQGARAIASSSLTTIAGLLCLLLMTFTIGRDLGFVLAKGVLLSLVCTFCVMPALILWFDGAMERTRKPTPYPKMRALSAYSFRCRYVLIVVFAALLAGGLVFKGMAQPAFVTPSKNPDALAIQEQFGVEEQLVVLYQAQDEGKSARITRAVEKMDGVASATSYSTSIGKQRKAAAMAREADMDAPLVRMLYYYGYHGGDVGRVDGRALAAYVRNGFAEDMGDMLDESTASKLDTLADILESSLGSGSYTLMQASKALEDHPSIKPGNLKLMMLAYQARYSYDESWTLSMEELMDLLVGQVLEDPAFDSAFDGATRQGLLDAQDSLQEGKENLVNADYGRIVCSVAFASDSPETDALCTQLRELLNEELSGDYWLVGKGPMVQEMAASFSGEFNFISWVTVGVIFAIVLLTFRNLIIPLLLVTLIQTAFNWDLALSVLTGDGIYYIAMIVVQSILMGATIDYAILYTTNYREARRTHGVRSSVGEAYRNSIRTITMSGSILVVVCFMLGMTAGGVTGQICLVISEGAAASVILVLLVLPGLLAAFDRLVVPKKLSAPKDAE
ncbi:MAG: efflux RND transporter permease subunit [Coriobacteriales bacterium]